MVVNIIVHYCCKRACYTINAKKKTETEETIGFFCHIFVVGSFSVGGGARPPLPSSLATPMFESHQKFVFYSLEASTLLMNMLPSLSHTSVDGSNSALL